MFGIAYRMLGSASDAEDLVQETWLRWQGIDRAAVENPGAFLATTITRLAINLAHSAHARRETYPGPWLPEPIDTAHDPSLGAEVDETVSFALQMLLEKVPPMERAAYVLREAFDYPYGQIAQIIQTTEAAARKLVSRARQHLLEHERPQQAVDHAQHRRLLSAFIVAARHGDLAALEGLLADSVISYSDGGGLRGFARVPVRGLAAVAHFYIGFHDRYWPGTEVREIEANGMPAVAVLRDGALVAVMTIGADAGGISRLLWVHNPDKLRRFALTV